MTEQRQRGMVNSQKKFRAKEIQNIAETMISHGLMGYVNLDKNLLRLQTESNRYWL